MHISGLANIRLVRALLGSPGFALRDASAQGHIFL